MIPHYDQETLVKWAASRPFVIRMWILGSRARGDSSPDSDLDVAIEIEPIRPSDANAYSSYCARHQGWHAEIQPYLSLRLHLCHYNPNIPETFEIPVPREDGTVEKIQQVSIVQEVERDGILIYDAARTPPNPTAG